MKNKIYIIIVSFLIFIILGSGITTYYIVNNKEIVDNKQYIEKKIPWNKFSGSKVTNTLNIYDKSTNKTDKYNLVDIDYFKIKTDSRIIYKTIKLKKITKIDYTKFPKKIVKDNSTILYYSSYKAITVYKDLKTWNERLVYTTKIYNEIEEADLIDIPKIILHNDFEWYMLTDKIKFTSKNNKYNCELPYYRVVKDISSEKIVEGYNVELIYKGKITEKSGYVTLKYKIETKAQSKILLKSNFKIFIIASSIFIITLIIIDIAIKKKEH